MIRTKLFSLCLCVSVVMFLLLGCAQETKTPVNQGSDQKTVTPTTSEQGQATQGANVHVNQYTTQYNHSPCDKQTAEDGSLLDLKSDDGTGDTETITQADSSAKGGSASGVKGRVAIASNSTGAGGITITTGGTTPGQTGTTSGTTSGTSQSPSASSSANPTQRPQAEASVALDAGVALPGGSVDQQATATGRGTSTGQTQTNTTEQRLAKLEATASKLESFLPLLEQLLSTTTQPAE